MRVHSPYMAIQGFKPYAMRPVQPHRYDTPPSGDREASLTTRLLTNPGHFWFGSTG